MVKTDPAGAYIVDTADGGFGNLGMTPLTKSFTCEEIEGFGQLVQIRGMTMLFLSLEARMRDVPAKRFDVYIPLGESRSFAEVLP